MEEKRQPDPIHYLSGAMMANSVVWIWSGLLSLIDNSFLIRIFTFLVYALGSASAAYLVARTASNDHIAVGLRTGVYAWIINVIMMTVNYSISEALDGILFFFGTLVLGGYVGGQLRRKRCS